MATQPSSQMSVEEYLEREEWSVDRHEYWHGEVFCIAGGTVAHADICANVLADTVLQLRGKKGGCRARGSDMRIRTGPNALYSYPDVVVSCPDERIEANTLLNPILIIEVLSKSTDNYDRGLKFEQYRNIPSFKEYVVIAQTRVYVEHHTQEDNHGWHMREHRQAGDVIQLASIDVSLKLADVYAGISFEAADL